MMAFWSLPISSGSTESPDAGEAWGGKSRWKGSRSSITSDSWPGCKVKVASASRIHRLDCTGRNNDWEGVWLLKLESRKSNGEPALRKILA